jgi:hypothetical protein
MFTEYTYGLIGTGCKVLNLAKGLESRRPTPRAQRCPGFEQVLGGEDSALKIKWFHFCRYLITVSA